MQYKMSGWLVYVLEISLAYHHTWLYHNRRLKLGLIPRGVLEPRIPSLDVTSSYSESRRLLPPDIHKPFHRINSEHPMSKQSMNIARSSLTRISTRSIRPAVSVSPSHIKSSYGLTDTPAGLSLSPISGSNSSTFLSKSEWVSNPFGVVLSDPLLMIQRPSSRPLPRRPTRPSLRSSLPPLSQRVMPSLTSRSRSTTLRTRSTFPSSRGRT